MYCGVNSHVNVGRGGGGVSGFSMSCVSGIVRWIIVLICLIVFVYSLQMKVREQ